MASADDGSDDRGVFVTGLTPVVTTVDLMMFLESSRCCPIGGTVQQIKHLEPEFPDSAWITFEDRQVAFGLIGKSLTLPDGPAITFWKADPRNTEQEIDRTNRQSSQVKNSKSKKEQHADRKSNIESQKGRTGRTGEKDASVRPEARLVEDKSSDDEDEWSDGRHRPTSSSSRSKGRQRIPSHKSTVIEEDARPNKHINIRSEDTETEIFPFKRDILMLIQLILNSTKDSIRDNLQYDFENEKIQVRGTADTTSLAQLKLYEIATATAHQETRFSPSIQDLISSQRGEELLQEEFSRNNLAAIYHKGRVVAKDEAVLKETMTLLKRLLITEDINVKENNLSYLHSEPWKEQLKSLLVSRVASVEFRESEKVVSVAGYISDVQEIVQDIKQHLQDNGSVTRSIKSKIGIVRLLKSMKDKNMDLNRLSTSLEQLNFGEQKGVISLRGLREEVDFGAKFIESLLKDVCYDKYEVTTPGLSVRMFRDEQSAGRDLIDVLEMKNECAIEVREKSRRKSEHHERTRQEPRTDQIHVLKSNIVEFQRADVLVNPVLNRHCALTQAFIKAGGEQMSQEVRQFTQKFSKKRPSYDFGNDLAVTSAHGSLRAKFILHVVIGGYRNKDSVDRMHSAIKKCLEIAKKKGAGSIAFPTLGCGRLGFRPQQIADCFCRAKDDLQSDLEIFIVSLEDDLVGKFHSLLKHNSAPISPNEAGIVFHLNALSEDTIQRVKEKLAKRLNDMTMETPIHDKAIAKLDRESRSHIKALQSDQVSIDIDTDKSTVTVRGEKNAANEARLKILSIIYRDSAKRESDKLSRLIDFNRVPDYWTKYKKLDKETGLTTTELSSGCDLHKEISRLVMETWEPDKVGHGNDAMGLGPHKIKIRKICCIENPRLYAKYLAQKQQFCIAAAKKPFPAIDGMKKERQVKTMTLGLPNLKATLSKSANEYFLLHGTKKEIVDSVKTQGLDTRLAGENAMFGIGAYLSESSTKADQYADSKDQRVSKGTSLHLFVCRVLLGSPFICQTPTRFRRPPCKRCHTEICRTTHRSLEHFDSVIGTHRSDNQRLLFREFIIYHPDQSYPDFLVKYERI